MDGHKEAVIEGRKMTRLQMTLLWNLNVDKKDRKTVYEIMPLPGDEEENRPDEPVPPSVMIQQLNAMFGNLN